MTDTPTTATEDVVLTKDDRIRTFNWLYGLVGNEGHESVSILEEYVSDMEDERNRLRAHTTTTLVACDRCGRGIPPRYAVDGRLCPECAGDELRIISQYLDANSDVPWVQHCLRRLAGDDATEGDYRRARGVAPAPEDSPLPEERIRRLREDGYIRD